MFYAYEVNRTKAYSAWEMGINMCVFDQEMPNYYSDVYCEEFRTLLGRFSAHSYNDVAGELQIIEDGEVHETHELFDQKVNFSVLEVAFMLSLSKQRVLALIANKQLKAKKRADIWLLSGKDILAFSLEERPAHRPKSKVQTS